MIIVDLNQVMIANIMVQIGSYTNVKMEVNFIRHMVLNSLRSYKQKFSGYGEMIIAADHRKYWRRDIFPYYKANRKKNREKSDLDWTSLFEAMNNIRNELKEFFPYRVIQVEGAEADDVISILVQKHGTQNVVHAQDPILILSGDKDFIQLQKFSNVEQYDPVRKKFIKDKNPELYLKQHIMRGDSGDGVPNFLSDDNCFVIGQRQKPLTKKKLEAWIGFDDPKEFCTNETMLRNYMRNKQLIDLMEIPDWVRNNIMDEYNSQKGKGRNHLFNYFIEHKLKNLMEHINEF